MNKSLSEILCILGPTGVGKSQLALQIAQKMPCEIISVDSAMIYRYMDIGTAKPTLDDRQRFPHHLINIRDPVETYSVGQFCEDVQKLINEILSRHKIPILVGGTMLYFHVLQNGIAALPLGNLEIRKKIQQAAEQEGWQSIHAKLNNIDSAAADRIHPNDPQRISRAMEVYLTTGKPLSELVKNNYITTNFKFNNIILYCEDNARLNSRIETRFDLMLQQGFVDEVEKLYARNDLHPDLPSIRSVGYRQVWKYLAGEFNYNVMKERAVIATRQLAKRQRTWLKKWKQANWFEHSDQNLLNLVINSINVNIFESFFI